MKIKKSYSKVVDKSLTAVQVSTCLYRLKQFVIAYSKSNDTARDKVDSVLLECIDSVKEENDKL